MIIYYIFDIQIGYNKGGDTMIETIWAALMMPWKMIALITFCKGNEDVAYEMYTESKVFPEYNMVYKLQKYMCEFILAYYAKKYRSKK